MAYDEELAERFRVAAAGMTDVTEKRMMGGICFFLNGNMLGGCDRAKTGERRFMFRVGKQNEAEALRRPGAVPMEFTGRRMGGMVFVDEAACDADALRDWIALSCDFVSSLPAK